MAGKSNKSRSTRKYSINAQEKISQVMRKFKKGTLKSGSGQKVTDRKQAIAIGISEAEKKGYKTPDRESSKD